MANNAAVSSGWVAQRLAALDGNVSETNSIQPAWLEFVARRDARRNRGRRLSLAAAAACLVSVCLMTFPAPRAFAQRCVDCSVALIQTLAPARSAPLLPEPRDAAPEIAARDSSSHLIALPALRGKVVLLNFWATWCHGCITEMPWFEDFHRRYGARGLVVVGAAMDDERWKAVRPFITEKQIHYAIVMGDAGIAARYGATKSLPITVLIDRHGRIAARHTGVPAKSEYEAQIRQLLAER